MACYMSWLNDSGAREQPFSRDVKEKSLTAVRNGGSKGVSTTLFAFLFSTKELPHGGSSPRLVVAPAVVNRSEAESLHMPGCALASPSAGGGKRTGRSVQALYCEGWCLLGAPGWSSSVKS